MINDNEDMALYEELKKNADRDRMLSESFDKGYILGENKLLKEILGQLLKIEFLEYKPIFKYDK